MGLGMIELKNLQLKRERLLARIANLRARLSAARRAQHRAGALKVRARWVPRIETIEKQVEDVRSQIAVVEYDLLHSW